MDAYNKYQEGAQLVIPNEDRKYLQKRYKINRRKLYRSKKLYQT